MKSYETPIFHRFSLDRAWRDWTLASNQELVGATDADCCEDGRGTQLLIG